MTDMTTDMKPLQPLKPLAMKPMNPLEMMALDVLRMGKWSREEDVLLRTAVDSCRENWPAVAEMVPGRTRKQCRDRWQVHTRSGNHTPLSLPEQVHMIDLHRLLGNQWKRMASHMEDRSEQHLKNTYNTRRKAKGPGDEPLLHRYVHGEAVHTLTGLDTPLVYGVVADTRNTACRDRCALDVEIWHAISLEAHMHIHLTELPLEDLATIEHASVDAPRGWRPTTPRPTRWAFVANACCC